MDYKLLAYGLKPLEKYFRWGDKGNDKPRKMWLIKDVEEKNNRLKITLFRGYKIAGTKEIISIEEKTVNLKKEYLEAMIKAVNERELDHHFRFKEVSDLLEWLIRNRLL